MRAAVRSASMPRVLVLCAALSTLAFAAYTRPEAAPAAAAAAQAVPTTVAGLPPEFAAIRPAGLDGSAPAIPPSELWPAQ